MKVGGEKTVRTEKDIDLGGPAVATAAQKETQPVKAPSLRRPGEEAPGTGVESTDPKAPAEVPDNPGTPPHFADISR
jgi:hypothetical protein